MKKMSKMNVNELRAYAVELGADEKKLYGASKEALKVIINELKKEDKEDKEMENKRGMLNNLTVKDLRELAKDNDIKGMSRASKEELITALMFCNWGASNPEEHTIKISKVTMYAFTGMVIGEFEAEDDGEHILVYTESKGELMFDRKTGKEITDRNKARYANRVERA